METTIMGYIGIIGYILGFRVEGLWGLGLGVRGLIGNIIKNVQ